MATLALAREFLSTYAKLDIAVQKRVHDLRNHIAICRQKTVGDNEPPAKAADVWRIIFQEDCKPLGLQFATLRG